jgi:murein DD-endopeptidase MepM/ murein hydrolase activator NlpD
MATIREDLLALEPLRWPVKGQLSSHFGDRRGHFHRGIDIRAPLGTVIVPAAQGKVIFAGRKKKYGKTVLIQHRFHQTLYAHLSSINVRRGEWVDLTQVIGKVGRSGNARGVHLHFEVIDGSANPLDPLAVVTRSQSLRLAKVNTAKGSRTRNTRIQ